MFWDDPDFLAEADAWIRSEADPSGPSERMHVRPWSTVWRVPTAGRVLWFKASSAIHTFEAPLATRLAALMPDRVVELVATDEKRGWMLMHDAGTRLRDADPSPGQLRHWERILPRYAELQLALAPSADELRLEPGGPEVLRLRDAYLEPFGPGCEEAVALAYRTGTLARAFAWYRYLVSDPRSEDGDAVAYGLKLFLAEGPIGSWEP